MEKGEVLSIVDVANSTIEEDEVSYFERAVWYLS